MNKYYEIHELIEDCGGGHKRYVRRLRWPIIPKGTNHWLEFIADLKYFAPGRTEYRLLEMDEDSGASIIISTFSFYRVKE